MPETLTTTTRVDVTPLAGHIGAEITGVDTGVPLSDDAVARIRRALLDHKVIFLRGQSLNYCRQVAFAERLGPLTLGHPTLASPPGQPLLEEIDSLKGGKVNYWHTDVTFVDRPPAFTLLHAVVIPPIGGDTIWANTVSAYRSLPAELRELADRLRVLHTNDFDYARTFNRGERVDPATAAAHAEFVSTIYETEHPLVRVHPETNLTGMRISMAGAWTSIVAAELIAATTGLGYLIMQAGDYLNTALVFSGIIAIAILGLALDACLRALLLLADPSRRR